MKEIEQENTVTKCPCRPSCPLKRALCVIGGKWKISILCALSLQKSIRYNELKRLVPGITNTMLATSLKELEEDGMIARVQYPEMPVRVEYSLTERGCSIQDILAQLKAWGLENFPEL
jgi:DNA-binding HxlR family transcriptional regulator